MKKNPKNKKTPASQPLTFCFHVMKDVFNPTCARAKHWTLTLIIPIFTICYHQNDVDIYHQSGAASVKERRRLRGWWMRRRGRGHPWRGAEGSRNIIVTVSQAERGAGPLLWSPLRWPLRRVVGEGAAERGREKGPDHPCSWFPPRRFRTPLPRRFLLLIFTLLDIFSCFRKRSSRFKRCGLPFVVRG